MNKYFTLRERYQLEVYYNEYHLTQKQIADKMNKHVNTIYNELKRGKVELLDTNLKTYKKYCADYAQKQYEYNATAKGRQLKIKDDITFANCIEDLIFNKKYSPYAALVKAKDKNFKTTVCFKTIYNYIHHNVFLKLSSKHVNSKKHKSICVKRINVKKQSIEERDKDINNRTVFGHWELDTVVGAKGTKNVLLVLTERKTRKELIYRMHDKTCDSTWKIFERIKSKLSFNFNKVFKTITCDNGVEFSLNSSVLKHNKSLNNYLHKNLYYCHPYCSSERGSNENCNKLIRKFIVKGSDISTYSDTYIKNVQDFINSYPRKLFGGLSANDMCKSLCIDF